jgi:hypothetical protein
MEVVRDDEDDTIYASSRDESNNITTPLFMDGLPHDFSSNPALAAIASLMNDVTEPTDRPGERVKSKPKQLVSKRKDKTKYKPYSRNNRTMGHPSSAKNHLDVENDTIATNSDSQNNNNAETTIGEASLFLKMWKL